MNDSSDQSLSTCTPALLFLLAATLYLADALNITLNVNGNMTMKMIRNNNLDDYAGVGRQQDHFDDISDISV